MAKKISGGLVHPLPADLIDALTETEEVLSLWEGLTPIARNEFICWVEDARQEKTRARRIRRTVEELREGQRRPCCWAGCIHRTDKKPGKWQQDVLIDKQNSNPSGANFIQESCRALGCCDCVERGWRMRHPLIGYLAGLAFAGTALAHHSPAAFDRTREVVVAGTVAAVAWRNPHIYLTLETPAPNGATTLQEVEVGPVAALQSLGLTRDTLVIGEQISVRAAPNQRGPGRTVMGIDMTRADGSIYPLHVSGRRAAPPPSPEASSLAGSWAPQPEDFLRLFREGVPALPVTAATRAAMADRASLVAAEATCISYPVPMLSLISVQRSIEIGDSTVTIRYDWMDVEQVIHLDQSEHPADVEPSLLGHSIGRWEGDTLVVDTVAYTPHRQGIAHGVPSTAAKRTIERLSLSEDRRHIDYEITVEDPAALTEPYTVGAAWDYRPDLQPSGEPCDPEIAARFMDD